MKMCRSMLPILMLTTVALSASDVLPILPDRNAVQETTFNIDDQSDDNIYSNSYQNSDLPNGIFYNKVAARDSYVSLPNFKDDILSMNNDDFNEDGEDLDENYVKEDNYDNTGYRKEQWHNYPRQLDRLQNSKHTRYETDEAAINKPSFSKPIDDHFDDYTTNEFRVESTDGDRNVYENVVAATNPFLVLKVQLMYLRDDADRDNLNRYPNLYLLQSKTDKGRNVQDNNYYMKDIESTANLVKVKREEPTNNEDNEIAGEGSFITEIAGNSSGRKKAVKKRLFSLWSRLQSLSHRGHELHHRRHLHAFYGLPDNKGNGIVTAQTRATFVRPPGSPLRWG